MKRIFMSMAGEGLGHACRAQALIEAFRGRYELHVFAPSAAYRMLAPLCEDNGVALYSIPGITNRYRPDHSLDMVGTGLATRHYVRNFPTLLDDLVRLMSAIKPDLAISDFEPALPRAARRAGVPWMSVDHQHFMLVSDLRELPPALQWSVRWMGMVVRGVCPPPPKMVISSFYRLPTKPRFRDVEQVGVLLRPAVRGLHASQQDHVLSYFRRQVPVNVLRALQECGRPVHIYGLGKQPRHRNLEFHALDGNRFLADLASCAALITTAGNQLIGEAMHFGKPVLAMPEAGNAEQTLNAHFLMRTNVGRAVDIERCRSQDVQAFLRDLRQFVPNQYAQVGDGTPRVVAAIERALGESAAPAPHVHDEAA